MSKPSNPLEIPESDQPGNSNPSDVSSLTNLSTTPNSAKSKLRKIPQIPIQRNHREESVEISEGVDDEEQDGNRTEESDRDDESTILLASSLGLNHIRTRSVPLPSPLRYNYSDFSPPRHGNDASKVKAGDDDLRPSPIKWVPHYKPSLTEQGKKIQWNQSKSLRVPSPLNPGMEVHNAAMAKEIQSPRFQAILRVTSGRKKKTPDIKSFSHELNSKGVKPFPFWKHRAFGHMEETMLAMRAKFDKLKEEVNFDLGNFAGDLVSILETTAQSQPELKEGVEDLLLVARKCAKMPPNEFLIKCEGIVQNLDDKRQEIPMGKLKQAHTRLLFILTRCTRLVQFQKQNGYEEDQAINLHQLSDLGVYSEKVYGTAPPRDYKGILSGKGHSEKLSKKSSSQEESALNSKQEQIDHQLNSDGMEVGTAKSVDSVASSYKMSSWKKLPSAAEKNQKKASEGVDTSSADKLHAKDEIKPSLDDNHENLDTPLCPFDKSDEVIKERNITWGDSGENQHITYENSMICRICEVEIPTVHVEEHVVV